MFKSKNTSDNSIPTKLYFWKFNSKKYQHFKNISKLTKTLKIIDIYKDEKLLEKTMYLVDFVFSTASLEMLITNQETYCKVWWCISIHFLAVESYEVGENHSETKWHNYFCLTPNPANFLGKKISHI